jgi:hypothetical protein
MIPGMTPEVYRLIHVAGALFLFLGLGGILTAAGKEGGKPPAFFLAMHGVGLLAMLVAGIGFVHKTGLPWQNWLSAKVGLWILIGALPFLVRRGIVPRFLGIVLVLGVAVAAVWIAQQKPF